MHVIFIASSAGDTEALLLQARQLGAHAIDFICITDTAGAKAKTQEMPAHVTIQVNPKFDLVALSDLLTHKDYAYCVIGVPSPYSEERPYNMARHLLKTGKTVIFLLEFMYLDHMHPFIQQLKTFDQCHIAVPTPQAKLCLIKQGVDEQNLRVIGHRSLRPGNLTITTEDEKKATKAALGLHPQSAMVFISGTSKDDPAVDTNTVLAISHAHPQSKNIQVFFGLHPAVTKRPNFQSYLAQVLSACKAASGYCRVIINTHLKDMLPEEADRHTYICADINGNQAAGAADGVGQAVFGNLVLNAIRQGKPTYTFEPLVLFLADAITETDPSKFLSAISPDSPPPPYPDEKIEFEINTLLP